VKRADKALLTLAGAGWNFFSLISSWQSRQDSWPWTDTLKRSPSISHAASAVVCIPLIHYIWY